MGVRCLRQKQRRQRQDKFISECRALTNVIGNGVATIVVSRWEGELDTGKMREVMGAAHQKRRIQERLMDRLPALAA